MTTKHTPGPWEAIGNLVRAPMVQPEGLPRGIQIADCRDGYFLSHTEEAKANARLIAAAPELLEALMLAQSIIGLSDGAASKIITKAIGGAI